jgi:hypothetical protein
VTFYLHSINTIPRFPQSTIHLPTFCFLQATHAVIFRLISGGFRSPNDSRNALAGGGRCNSSLISARSARDEKDCVLFEWEGSSPSLFVPVGRMGSVERQSDGCQGLHEDVAHVGRWIVWLEVCNSKNPDQRSQAQATKLEVSALRSENAMVMVVWGMSEGVQISQCFPLQDFMLTRRKAKAYTKLRSLYILVPFQISDLLLSSWPVLHSKLDSSSSPLPG